MGAAKAGGTKTVADGRVHEWERAGLGPAPYKFVGAVKKLFQAVPGDPDCPVKPGSCCDYCATAIVWEHWFRAADGREFKVGCDCFFRAEHPKALVSEVERANRKIAAQERQKKAKAVVASLDDQLADDGVRARLASIPHPKIAGLSALDYATWIRERAGAAGRAKLAKFVSASLKAVA